MKQLLSCLSILIICLCSCSTENIESPVVEDETVTLGIKCSTPEVTETPMTRAASDEGLYGIVIEEVKSIDSGGTYNCSNYAVGFFEDLSNVTASLIKNKSYAISALYVPDGKNKLYHVGNVYGNPFANLGPEDNPTLGCFVYGGVAGMSWAQYGAAQAVDHSSPFVQSNTGNNIDIYYGGTVVTPTADLDININLYLQMFSVNVNVENLTKGEVAMTYNMNYNEVVNYNGYLYKATPSNPTINTTMEIDVMPWSFRACSCLSYSKDGNEYTSNPFTDEVYKNWNLGGTLHYYYIKEDGTVLNLFDLDRNIKRMTKYNISFNLDDYIDGDGNGIKGAVKVSVQNDDTWEVVDIKK